jgi:hypothetical protein
LPGRFSTAGEIQQWRERIEQIAERTARRVLAEQMAAA